MAEIKKEQTIIQYDPWLEPYLPEIEDRVINFQKLRQHITDHYGGLYDFAATHKYLGFFPDFNNNTITFREWAPAASSLSLVGDFNNWDPDAHPLERVENPPSEWAINYGLWEIVLPFFSGNPEEAPDDKLHHGSRVKLNVNSMAGEITRLPSHIHYACQFHEEINFTGVIQAPPDSYPWHCPALKPDIRKTIRRSPFIYEAHAGMAQEKEGIGTWREFADNILPHIAELGYNVIQLMGVLEHPFYGSYGYHVSSFFASSSRFGPPDDLKYLIDKAHEAGIAIIADMVHSHCVKNLHEGLNLFDGTEYQYFHEGDRGEHHLWDSKLFNYNKREVQAFLLSSLRYWLEEYNLDGFRFDGVTSMLYEHHGQNKDFDHYDLFFKYEIDTDAISYIQLANTLIHTIKPEAISVAEDMSGMPGLGLTPEEGGLGFDFRLAMGMPDYWIKILKEKKDEEWNLNEIWQQLKSKRPAEKVINYCESHDQALVGDKTLAFRLMDQEMYWHMKKSEKHPVIERGVALHKLIRLISMSIGGDGWLCFMGNEFGHPEWIDFPRPGNNFSYKYARRQWSLCRDPELWYHDLCLFDKAIVELFRENDLMRENAELISLDLDNRVLAFLKGKFLFVFNFSINHAVSGYRIGVPFQGNWQLRLSSDEKIFGGQDRIKKDVAYIAGEEPFHGKDHSLQIYTVPRSVSVYKYL